MRELQIYILEQFLGVDIDTIIEQCITFWYIACNMPLAMNFIQSPQPLLWISKQTKYQAILF